VALVPLNRVIADALAGHQPAAGILAALNARDLINDSARTPAEPPLDSS